MSSHYLTPEALTTLVLEAQQLQTMTPELYAAIRKITFGLQGDEDMVQEVALDLWLKLDKLDTTRNVFAYITQFIYLEKCNRHRMETAKIRGGGTLCQLDEEWIDLLAEEGRI